jgi:hypothetical protein
MALVSSSFAAASASRLKAVTVSLRSHESANPDHLKRKIGEPVVVEEKFASDEVEGSKDKVEVEENVRKNVENELARAQI